MTVGDVLEFPDRAGRARAPAFDLVVSKLRRPLRRPGTVPRAVLERLGRARPVASVVAPAGYGKTTLLAEWAERDSASFAWVSVDDRDNDPKVFLAYVAEALDRVEPVNGRVFDALADPASSVSGSVVPRLAAAFAAMTSPVVLVVDDVHLLHNRECRSALSVLAEHVPAGSVLALAGRDSSPLRIARLRAEGRVTEVGPADLSLTAGEAAALLLAAEVSLDAADVARLHQRTEGWPVGLYLAALYLREGGSVGDAAASFGGRDRLVSDYLESEFLDRISGPHREFLMRSAALTTMSGALCEAALDLPGAAAMLVDLAGSNMLLVPLDRQGQWYRYHQFLGEVLQAELEHRQPSQMPEIRRRAASWCVANGRPEDAVEYSIAGQDAETASKLIEQLWLPTYWRGQSDTLERWLGWLDGRDAIRGRPMIAALASFHYTVTGRPVAADRWAALLDQWQYTEQDWAGDVATEAFTATLRAVHCRHGVDQMQADLDEADAKYAASGILSPTSACYRGLASLLRNDIEQADSHFRTAIEVADQAGARQMVLLGLCEQALLAIARGAWTEAELLSDQAAVEAERPGNVGRATVGILRARIALQRGDLTTARDALTYAQPLRSLQTYALPITAVQFRIEMARAHLALDDKAGATTLLREIDEVLLHRPHLGSFAGAAAELRLTLEHTGGTQRTGPSTLTTAELRLLPMLSTHLTVPEIAAEMYLSPHTIRAQTRSIYRKLDANTRHQAITNARDLHLVE